MLTDDYDNWMADRPSTVGSSVIEQARVKDQAAWETLVECYYPKIYSWCRKSGLDEHGAYDVCQDVFRSLMVSLPRFVRRKSADSMTAWLRVITRRRMADHYRRKGEVRLPETLDPIQWEESTSQGSESVGSPTLLQQTVNAVRGEFQSTTWQAFWLVTVEEQAAADVANTLGITRNAVYVAKSRVSRRLQTEWAKRSRDLK